MILTCPSDIKWKEYAKGAKLSEPGLINSGYEMQVLYLPKKAEFIPEKDTKTIVTLLRGRLRNPQLSKKDSNILENITIKSIDDSLLFLCYDLGDNGKIQDTLSGLNLNWIEAAKGCFRSEPKIEVDNYKINLWYLIPNHNGGIHNHNVSKPMIEVHTQLRGDGWMVKYREQDENTEYKRFEMKIGKSHPLFCEIKNGKVKYPWHAYVTGSKGALFIAFEDYAIKKN